MAGSQEILSFQDVGVVAVVPTLLYVPFTGNFRICFSSDYVVQVVRGFRLDEDKEIKIEMNSGTLE